MSPIQIPEPEVDTKREEKLYLLVSRGFAVNRWRSDFADWANKRIWAEKHQKHLVQRLEKFVLGHTTWRELRVLDLGSGRGGISVALRLAGARVFALDLRHRNCRILRLRAARYGLTVSAVSALGEHLPFAGDRFDLVLCMDVTEHCAQPDRLLREVARVLKSDGKAYVTFINRFSWDDPHYHIPGINFMPRPLAEGVIRLVKRNKDNGRDLERLSDMHYYSLNGAKKAAIRAGLTYEDITLRRMRDDGKPQWRKLFHERLSLGTGKFEACLARRVS